ncbi:MAG: hypothetical protein U5J64_00210 [Halobacteriales archaeon]|nr:hypothetical protein [Halobacteriales archaeon]
MAWHAVGEIEDSFEATKTLLLPFSLRRWLVMALAVFFVSGSTTSGVNVGPFSTGSASTAVTETNAPGAVGNPVRDVPTTVPGGPDLFVVLAVVSAVIVLGIIFTYVSSVMEFVFVKMTARQEVRVRGFFGGSMGKGVSLFAFRIAVGFVLAGTIALLVVMVILSGGFLLIPLLLLSPVFVLFAVALWLVGRFTVDFVVPVMLVDDVGIVKGWRTFFTELRAEWEQYTVYAVVRFVLGIVASFAVGVGVLTLVLLLGIPFGIVALFGFFLGEFLAMQTVALVLIVGVVILFALTLVVAVVTFVQVPVQTYLRYYSLFVLGAVSPEYDMVDEVRSAIVTEDETE